MTSMSRFLTVDFFFSLLVVWRLYCFFRKCNRTFCRYFSFVWPNILEPISIKSFTANVGSWYLVGSNVGIIDGDKVDFVRCEGPSQGLLHLPGFNLERYWTHLSMSVQFISLTTSASLLPFAFFIKRSLSEMFSLVIFGFLSDTCIQYFSGFFRRFICQCEC